MSKLIIQEETKKKFIKLLSEKTGGCITDACKALNVSRPTINNWRGYDQAFDQEVQEAILEGKEELADLAEVALKKRIEQGDTTAIIFTLKSLKRKHYGEKSVNEPLEESDKNVYEINTPSRALFYAWSYIFMVRETLRKFNLLSKEHEETLTKLYKDFMNDKRYNDDKESS